jgi:hypothetical protein
MQFLNSLFAVQLKSSITNYGILFSSFAFTIASLVFLGFLTLFVSLDSFTNPFIKSTFLENVF